MNSPPRLRILHIIPHLGIGGAELQLHQLVTHTPADAASHAVLYYADARDHGAEEVFRGSGIDCTRIPRTRGGVLGFTKRLAAAVESARPDVVHCWLVSACFWGRLASRRTRARPLVLSFRSSLIEHALILRLSRRLGDDRVFYLANTRAVAASIGRALGVPAGKITVIPNGVDGVVRPPPPGGTERESAPGGNGERTVITVGRLAREKNYPMLLRVAARFGAAERVRFLIVGHGELEAALRAQAAGLGLGERVRFLGLRSDVPELLGTADLFAFTSRIEGAPNAVLEAMAAGLPIVSTRFEGVDEILTADHDALLVDHDDDARFEAALRGLLADRARRETLGANARRTVKTRFSISATVGATLDYYRRLLDAPA